VEPIGTQWEPIGNCHGGSGEVQCWSKEVAEHAVALAPSEEPKHPARQSSVAEDVALSSGIPDVSTFGKVLATA